MKFSIENIKLIFEELYNNKLRSFLSLLGVSIGIFCIVSVLSVFDSMREHIQNNMAQLGASNLYVGKYPWIPPDDSKGEYPWWKYKSRPVTNYKEMIQLKENIDNIKYICISYSEFGKIATLKNEFMSNVYAVSNNFERFQNFDISQGRYFTKNEMFNAKSNLIVIGDEVAKALFNGNENVIGKEVQVSNHSFIIIGVMKKKSRNQLGFDFNNTVIVPYLSYATIKDIDNNVGNGFVDPILMIEGTNKISMNDLLFEVKSTLRTIRKLKINEPDNFSINKMDAIQKKVDEIFSKIKLAAWLVGFFSLLVGCFSIANIMFVSVNERTAQIGLKKAIGATSQSIKFDFIVESVFLCFIGGILGVILIVLFGIVMSLIFDFPIYLSFLNFLLASAISIIVGVVAGYIPARNAAKLNPVDALRK